MVDSANLSGIVLCPSKNIIANKLVGICENLTKSTVLTMGTGYCLGASTVVKSFLKLVEIDCKLVEVTLLIQKDGELLFIGYEDVQSSHIQGTLETHVVVVTNTNPSYIIDTSIGNYLPDEKTYFIYEIPEASSLGTEPLTIPLPKHPTFKLTYSLKRIQKYAVQVQESLVERIETDKKIFKRLGFLKKLIYLALVISLISALRGFFDFYLTFINKENYWGPTHIKEIIQRLENLEKRQGLK